MATSIDAVNAYLKQWQKSVKCLGGQLASIQNSMQPIIDAQKTFQQSLEPFLAESERQRKLLESVHIPKNTLLDISHLAGPALELQRFIQDIITPAFEQLRRNFRDLPPRTQKALLLLGTHGWYLDLEMPFPRYLWELEKALSKGNVEEVEEALAEHFESRLDEIEASIIERFPKRAKIIQAAFKAHRRKEYELSIPLLFAQTDGICKEVVKQNFFMKKNKKPRTAIYVEQIASDTFRAALLSPLTQTLPIGASEHERPEDFNELNRHMVLHGESLDYGTKVNSLKAVSLINYVAHVLTLDNENP